MLEWLSANKEWIAPATSIGTLLVWLFYAQLLYSGYSRQTRPRLLINKGVGDEGLDSPCLICNMSQEAIFIYFILVYLENSEDPVLVPVTDCEDRETTDESTPLGSRTRQGPLQSGKCLELLSFRIILERAAAHAGIELRNGRPVDPDIELGAMEFHVVCIYGSDDSPFGAVRKFNLRLDDPERPSVTPATVDTQRKTSWRYKRKIQRWLQNDG
ncbi:MAG TPA: hypothetical protein VIN33_07785 [Marinobacter sp.]